MRIIALLLLISLLPNSLLSAPPRKPPPVAIKVALAKKQKVEADFLYLGSIVSANSAILSLERAGVVSQVFAKDNSYIVKGSPILQINPDVVKANLAAAAASLKLAKTENARLKKLYASKAISASSYDQSNNNLQVAKANFKLYKAQLEQTILRAPFSGHLSFINVSKGEYINPGVALTNINDLKRMKVVFYMPQERLRQLKKPQQIVIVGADGKQYTVKSFTKSTIIDPSTRLFQVEALLANSNFLPGSYVKTHVKQLSNVVMLPETAVGYSVEGPYIYKFSAQQPVKTKVTLGLHLNGMIEVKSGISEGEQYVAVGQFKIYPNAPLIIVK